MFWGRGISAKESGMLTNLKRWIAAHPAWTLAVVTFLALAPFLAKPFNIDDPLFLWTAKQIQAHPADPYGFDVNWYGEMQPMWSVTENPPLASYYLALGAAIFGWGEIGLHLVFLLPAIAVVLGTWRLARSFCQRALPAALAALFAPVFLVSSTTLMCDVPMLALWVWAIVCWVEGHARGARRMLLMSAVLVSLAALTKYFGVCLIPLLAAYSIFLRRRLSLEIAFLMVPLAVLGLYQWITYALYGYPLLSEAAAYAKYAQGFIGLSKAEMVLTALSFCGGCVAPAVILAPWLWRGRTLAIFGGMSVLSSVALFAANLFSNHYSWIEGPTRLAVELQVIFWVFGGISVLALAIADLRRHRDAASWLLFFWVFGTFLFAAVFNWTVNGRSFLPLAPAIGILIARGLDARGPGWASVGRQWIGFAVAAVLALVVVRADFLVSCADRRTALATADRYRAQRDAFYFEGHWGFQYYMELEGMRALDFSRSELKPGDILAVPVNNTSIKSPVPAAVVQWDEIRAGGSRWSATMDPTIASGFYASVRGPLPFAFGKTTDESVYVYHLGTNAATSLPR